MFGLTQSYAAHCCSALWQPWFDPGENQGRAECSVTIRWSRFHSLSYLPSTLWLHSLSQTVSPSPAEVAPSWIPHGVAGHRLPHLQHCCRSLALAQCVTGRPSSAPQGPEHSRPRRRWLRKPHQVKRRGEAGGSSGYLPSLSTLVFHF